MVQTSKQQAAALLPVVKKFFRIGMNEREGRRAQLYTHVPTTRPVEEIVGLGAADPSVFDQFRLTGTKGKIGVSTGYTTQFIQREYPIDIEIPNRLIRDSQDFLINNIIMEAGEAYEAKREIDAASIFNNAFDVTNFPGVDGQSLCDGAHPRSRHDVSNTYSNTGTDAASASVLKTMRNSMRKVTNDKGLKLGLTGNMLIYPDDLHDSMVVATRTEREPGGSNNDVNTVYNAFQLVPWIDLSDDNNFFMVNQARMKRSLYWFERIPFRIRPELIEIDNVNTVFKAEAEYTFGYADWRWMRGHAV